MYLVLIDRFRNGDPSNDDFGKGEHDPNDDDCFQGGDLKGVAEKLPYLKRLGIDAIWITPPVHNQWINPYIRVRGYHGYWAYDFTRVDPHFGTLEDYKALVARAHRLGIKVIQDIVVNHTGNYFTVAPDGYDPRRPERNWRRLEAAYPPEGEPKAPNDPVFRMNDPNVPEHKRAAVYNFTPNITDFTDRRQTLTYAMGDLDDINLRSPLAVERLKEIYRYWIDEVGVDGFRVDTVYYTPEEFYGTFLHDPSPRSPGVKRHAARKGRSDFLVFGEVWSYDYRSIGRYLRDGTRPRLDSAVDLPLNEALGDVFFKKAATSRLKAALEAPRANARLWVNFLDNHDVERIHGRGSAAAARQALVALFTLPGIPCVYYGTEAGLTKARENMFRDERFDETSESYRFLRSLIAFRRRRPVFRRGRLKVVRASQTSGLLAYETAGAGVRCLTVFNTSSDAALYDPGPGRLRVLLSSEGRKEVSGPVPLAPESYLVLERRGAASRRSTKAPSVALKAPGSRVLRGEASIGLRLKDPGAVEELSLLADDNYGRRIPADPRASSLALDTARLGNGPHELRLLARGKDGSLSASKPLRVEVRNPYRLLAARKTPKDCKGGLGARVLLPADPSYGGQLSMEAAEVLSSGRDLRLRLRMKSVTRDWNPPQGFDHVYFSVFFDFPGRPGKRFFPMLGYARPDFEFNLGFLLHGWGARGFRAEDSSPSAYGAPPPGDVSCAADPRAGTVAFTFSERFFEGVEGFRGTKVFVSTWDGYLGELRGFSRKREAWSFHVRGAGPVPKIYDHVLMEI